MTAPPAVPFRAALRFWVKLGFISFGGPAGQIAIMHRELVERRGWISEARFLHALNYCMLLPGPEAQQLATYIGWLLHGTAGGLVAGAAFVAPSIALLLGLSYGYAAYGSVAVVSGVLAGFKPVVVAIVAEAVLRIGRRACTRWLHYAIAAAAWGGIAWLHVPFPLIVVFAALLGLLSPPSPEPAGATAARRDDVAVPTTRPPSPAAAWRTLAIGAVLWATPLVLVVSRFGWDSLYARLYRFFTLAAFVTFGGAYAVLAYATQMATHSGWLTPAQVVDGLALAETTPGPLIMVLQFIGFLVGWNQPQGVSPLASAVIAALLTTYATFLPSFLFIFIGAPYVEVLRNSRPLGAALSGVTAAVTGVVLSLAVSFGLAVLWPRGFAAGIDWFASALGVAAFVALQRLRVGVAWVILAGGLLGALRP